MSIDIIKCVVRLFVSTDFMEYNHILVVEASGCEVQIRSSNVLAFEHIMFLFEVITIYSIFPRLINIHASYTSSNCLYSSNDSANLRN